MKNMVNKWVDGLMLCIKIGVVALVMKTLIVFGLGATVAACNAFPPYVGIMIACLFGALLIPLITKRIWDLLNIENKSNQHIHSVADSARSE